MNVNDVEEYYNELVEKYEKSAPDFALNSDRIHNSTIMRFMLDKSNIVNMFCGEMSVFRKPFYDKIFASKGSTDEELREHLQKELIKSLTSFIERNATKLNIYIENFNQSDINKELISKEIANDKIQLYKIDKDLILNKDLSHISHTDSNIVRMETPQSHEAICSINTPDNIMNDWKEFFSTVEQASHKVELKN